MRFMRVQTPDLEWYKNNVPCQVACPAKTDIPRYISLIAQHRYRESYEVNCGSNLFPDVLGRVCSHPCETVCRRKKIDGKPIAIRDLKRVAADYRDSISPAFSPVQMMTDDGRNGVAPNMWKMKPPAQEKGKVAVIGAGPGGLACAHDLAARGFEVHVYESLNAVGGALYIGIPPYRLPRKYIYDMQRDLEEMGVIFHLNTEVGVHVPLKDLLPGINGIVATVLAMGCIVPNPMDVPGEDLEGVEGGSLFMKRINLEPFTQAAEARPGPRRRLHRDRLRPLVGAPRFGEGLHGLPPHDRRDGRDRGGDRGRGGRGHRGDDPDLLHRGPRRRARARARRGDDQERARRARRERSPLAPADRRLRSSSLDCDLRHPGLLPDARTCRSILPDDLQQELGLRVNRNSTIPAKQKKLHTTDYAGIYTDRRPRQRPAHGDRGDRRGARVRHGDRPGGGAGAGRDQDAGALLPGARLHRDPAPEDAGDAARTPQGLPGGDRPGVHAGAGRRRGEALPPVPDQHPDRPEPLHRVLPLRGVLPLRHHPRPGDQPDDRRPPHGGARRRDVRSAVGRVDGRTCPAGRGDRRDRLRAGRGTLHPLRHLRECLPDERALDEELRDLRHREEAAGWGPARRASGRTEFTVDGRNVAGWASGTSRTLSDANLERESNRGGVAAWH